MGQMRRLLGTAIDHKPLAAPVNNGAFGHNGIAAHQSRLVASQVHQFGLHRFAAARYDDNPSGCSGSGRSDSLARAYLSLGEQADILTFWDHLHPVAGGK